MTRGPMVVRSVLDRAFMGSALRAGICRVVVHFYMVRIVVVREGLLFSTSAAWYAVDVWNMCEMSHPSVFVRFGLLGAGGCRWRIVGRSACVGSR